MAGFDGRADLELARKVASGDGAAWRAFVRRFSDSLFGLCAEAFGDEAAAGAAYVALFERLSANGGSALADYNGRAPLADYLVLKAADLLADHIAGLFAGAGETAWRAFERFFRRDIERAIARRFAEFRDAPEAPEPADVYQEVCAELVADGFRRLRAYDGMGSFSGFVRRTVRNMVEDLARRALGRRRLPQGVAGLPDFDQQVFRLAFWDGREADEIRLLVRRSDDRPTAAAEVAQALARVAPFAREETRPRFESLEVPGDDGEAVERQIADPSADPEAALARRRGESLLEEALGALKRVLAELSEEARLYLQCRFLREPPLKPAEIAPLLGLPVKDLYRLRARWERELVDGLARAGIEKFPELDV